MNNSDDDALVMKIDEDIKGNENEAILVSWEDASTLFHEFGHALHGLNSNVTYPSLSGTNTPRDYVEFPSQILERWLATPEVLNRFALHYKTNVPMPMTLVNRIEKASTFNEGFSTVETISSALVDMKLHLLENPNIDPKQFEKETLDKLKQRNVKVSNFIRLAIAEKLKRDAKELIVKPKTQYCPF
jgi:peptidyl-dipeptidase Dcp